MQKFTILGITLYDYGAREALRNTDRFLGSGGLNTVAYISSAQIAQASRDVELKESVEQLDMTLCTEPDLLEAAGIAARSRIREIDEKVYLRELLRKLYRNRNSVYLLADTQPELEVLEDLIQEYQGNLYIQGPGEPVRAFGRQPERLVNELNDVAPDAVLSRMPWPHGYRPDEGVRPVCECPALGIASVRSGILGAESLLLGAAEKKISLQTLRKTGAGIQQ